MKDLLLIYAHAQTQCLLHCRPCACWYKEGLHGFCYNERTFFQLHGQPTKKKEVLVSLLKISTFSPNELQREMDSKRMEDVI